MSSSDHWLARAGDCLNALMRHELLTAAFSV
jgi:hypothetical protein